MSSPTKVTGPSKEEKKLPISSHLEEIRRRLLYSTIAVVITTMVAFFFADNIFQVLESRAEGINLVYIEMTEMIGTYFRVAFISGIVLALPFLVYQLVMFVRPGLTKSEKRYLYLILPSVTLAFAAGVAFGYFVLIPPVARFLITFGSNIATPEIRVSNFVSLMIKLLFAIGLCFEMPPLMFFLAKIHVITAQQLARYRRFAIIGAFILGAIITPTFDPINQSIVAVPLIILYEIGILLARLARPKKA